MNKLDKDYCNLLQDILDNGTKKQTRNGEVISVFGRQIRHSMKDGFPLLTTKKVHFKSIVSELLWFLQGRTDLRWLLEQNNTIWVGDAYQNYIKNHKILTNEDEFLSNGCDFFYESDENTKYGKCRFFTQEEFIKKIKTDDKFAKKWGSLGKIYGYQWRNWITLGVNPRKFDFDAAWKKHTEIWVANNGGSGPSFNSFTQSIITNENLGIAYGYHKKIDQIANLIHDLKTNPDNRRLMVNAWNVGELEQMTLPPCHYSFQVYTRELSREERVDLYIKKYGDTGMDYEKYKNTIPTRAISLMWNQRSVDTPLGLPFNIGSYALLLEIIAKMVNMVPDELIGSLGDTHIYVNQIDGCKEQIKRDGFELPRLSHLKTDSFYKDLSNDLSLLEHLDINDFKIENYESHSLIKFPLSN
jgi:thymidylate synthase